MEIYTAAVTLKDDADADQYADELDMCSVEPDAPGACGIDADGDGYGNCCDGDLDNDWDVDAQDFSQKFLPCFMATVDDGSGCDMDCDGDVDAQDFNNKFFPQFTQTFPGPSGLPCAGTVPCEPGDARF